MPTTTLRTRSILRPLAATLACTVALALGAPALAADDGTVDILYMQDGRELIGQIVEDRGTEVVFELEVAGIKTKVTYPKRDIARMMEDQPDPNASEADAEASAPRRDVEVDDERTDEDLGYGVVRATERREGVPGFYLVPMRGQMGTDVNPEVYRQMIEDIRAQRPDYLIIEMECLDEKEGLYDDILPFEKSMDDIGSLDKYRRIADIFHDELGDIEQILWVRDSQGMSSLVGLSWDTIFMESGARFGGLEKAKMNFEAVRQDANMYGKYREAYMGLMRGFALRSGRGNGFRNIVDAMVRPEFKLAATWEGREVIWTLDDEGEYTIDGSAGRTANFTARTAENFGISAGTADSLDDIALLLGIREYDVIDSEGKRIFDEYYEDWHAAFDKCIELGQEYEKFLGWAQGDEWLAYYSKAKRNLEQIVKYIERYEALEIRLSMLGFSKSQLELQIELMEEEIRAYRQASRNRGGTRRPGGGGFGAGG